MEQAAQRPSERRSSSGPPRPPPPGSTTAIRGDHTQERSPSFRAFQKIHDKAFAAVQKALNADEEEDVVAAEHYYANSVALLRDVLQTDCENLPDATSGEKDSAKQMQQKMNKTELQITYRLESLRSSDQLASGSANTNFNTDVSLSGPKLPSYEEAVSSSHSSLISDEALGNSIMSSEYPGIESGQRVSADGIELFSIAEGVQIFYISKEGNVSAPSYPSSLHIVKLQEGGEAANNAPPAFMQVGNWFYPLIPGSSPVLHATFGAYLFPDLSPEGAGASVGLMLPDSINPEEKCMLEDILKNFSVVQEQQTQIQPEDLVYPSAPPLEETTAPKTVRDLSEEELHTQDQSTSAKISQGISVASKWISWGVGKGAVKAGELISYGSSKLRARLQPENEPKTVDPRVQTGMVYARKATNAAVSVSGFIVNKLGQATMALGRQVAPHIRKTGEKLMPRSMSSDKCKSTMDGVLEVAASGVQGFGTVYMSLEGAAKNLARSLANETVATVQHKYGDQAGRLTENAVFAVGNVAMTTYNANNLGVKAVAKRAAKDAGKAVLQDVQDKNAAKKQNNGQTNGVSDGKSDGSYPSGKHPM